MPDDDQGNDPQAAAAQAGAAGRTSAAASGPVHGDDSTTILHKIGKAVRSLVELEVITAVGEFPVTLDADGRLKFQPGQVQGSDLLVTRINLAQGDITNYIDPAFLAGERAVLREYHERQVEAATAIMDKNVQVFTDLAKAFGLKLEKLIEKADSGT